jgi:cellulose synthase/poly-beta-1,6-N-acetylglucosamine synthase-like glycosyltransferase
MLKELLAKLLGFNNKSTIKGNTIKKFESVEEGRKIIAQIRGNKEASELAKYLNRKGYRTVKGLRFTKDSVKYYCINTNQLEKVRNKKRENHHARKTDDRTAKFVKYLRYCTSFPIDIFDVRVEMANNKSEYKSSGYEMVIEVMAFNMDDYCVLQDNDYALAKQLLGIANRYFRKNNNISVWAQRYDKPEICSWVDQEDLA